MIRAIAALAAAAVLAAAVGAAARPAKTETAQVERGRYLVEAVAGCNDCHTPMTPTGPDMSQSLQGANLVFGPLAPMPWAAQAPEIAGLGGYSEAHVATLLQTGARPDGSRPLPPMPPYRLTEADAKAVIAYLKTLPKAQ